LEQQQIIRRELYQSRPKRYRYHLTEKGRDLGPVMRALVGWAKKYIPDTLEVPDVTSDAGG
jgi:DNA-binding HxlR family transcriptional regulator